jgi:hypothetical protein
MKHLIYICALLLVSNFGFAQDTEEPAHNSRPTFHTGHELIVGHGFLPANSQRNINYYGYNYNYENDRSTGAIFATYRFHLSRLLSLGITGAYEHQKGTWNAPPYLNYYDPYNPMPIAPVYSYPVGNIQRSRYTIASEITFTYVRLGNGLVSLYSLVGLGYTFNYQTTRYAGSDTRYYTPDGNPVVFNGHISPIGIRFGRALGGFAEFGTGYKGVMNYGLSYKF